jgi:hypothetical protein
MIAPERTRERRNARRRYVRALLATWAGADDYARTYGPQWYGRAHEQAAELAERYGFTVAQAAGAIAAMSPRVGWGENLADADTLLSWAERARDEPDAPYVPEWALKLVSFSANRDRAIECLTVDDPLTVLRGPKQRAFYLNIMGDATGVTVDVWATRAATRGQLDTPGTSRRYADIAAAYRTAARAVGVAPRDFQAGVWIAARATRNVVNH